MPELRRRRSGGVSVGEMPLPVAGEVNALATLHRQRGYAAIYPRPDAPKHTAPPSRDHVHGRRASGNRAQEL